MFGGKKLQDLEAQVRQLQEKLTQETNEKTDLAQKLESANSRIAEMEAQLKDFDLEKLKEEAKASRAEYEGLKDLYARKNREFDDSKEEEEQRFARDQALQRHNLENEIRDNRQANQDYVASTVKSFGESYNYYLNQIKVLMDALGNVATRTGEALFSGENTDLKARFGTQMRDVLRSGVDTLQGDAGDLMLIGSRDEPEVHQAEEEVDEESVAAYENELEAEAQSEEESEEEASDVVDDAADVVVDVAEAAEETLAEAGEGVKSFFEESAEAVADAVDDAVDGED